MNALKVNASQQSTYCVKRLYPFNFTLIDTALRVNKNECIETEDQVKHPKIRTDLPDRVSGTAVYR